MTRCPAALKAAVGNTATPIGGNTRVTGGAQIGADVEIGEGPLKQQRNVGSDRMAVIQDRETVDVAGAF